MKVVSSEIDSRKGVVIVEGASYDELNSQAAAEMALKHASAKGLTRAGLSGMESPYAVNANGENTEAVNDGREKVAAYRRDFPVSAGL